ncbi:MAG: 2-oxoacid:acceptor oxidoreductase family protein [Desulfatibacillum sp.]|nr:2-oxoacid:acceptor oxidoreductase family protein [Desulfatibacillum sp.]
MERHNLVFTGSGGQGVITAAVILAETAVLHEGLVAVQSQTYGAAARGGSTRADVIIAKSEILFPKVLQPNLLVSLTQEAYSLNYPILRPGGILISDPKFVNTEKKVDAIAIQLPMYQGVMDEIGKPIVYNVCMLGAVARIIGIVKPESIMKVLETRIPRGFLEMNQKALELGYDMAAPYENFMN